MSRVALGLCGTKAAIGLPIFGLTVVVVIVNVAVHSAPVST